MSRTVGGGKMEDGGGINTEHMSWLAYNNITITAQSIMA